MNNKGFIGLSIVSLAFIFSLTGCNNEASEGNSGNDSTLTEKPEVKNPMRVNVNDFKLVVINKNDAGIYRKLVTDADSLLNLAFNLPEFKDAVLAHRFDWKDLGNGRKDSLTSQEVFDSLFTKKKLAEVNLFFKKKKITNIIARLYGTVGKTIPGSNSTVTYTDWIDLSDENYLCTLLSYTSHIAHEYCHQRNFFDKDYDQSIHRDVVPYAIGDIVCMLLNEKFKKSCNCDE
jgi:hypothetical protein